MPAAPQVIADFHVGDSVYTTLLVSIWELGEGIGPFFIGPLAERFGRLPVYHIGNLLGSLCSVAGALSTDISMLVAFRFLSGLFSTSLTLGPTITGDMFRTEERGSAMAIALGLQLVGPFIAPICGSFIAQSLGWRWTLWLNAIAIGAGTLLGLVVLRETYAVKILERRARRLRKETGNEKLRSKFQAHVDASTVFESLTRPMQVLFRSPTVMLISVYTALAYALSYVILTTLTEIMESKYNFGEGVIGLAFIAPSTGNVLGMFAYMLTSDRYVKWKAKQSPDGNPKPEHRLLPMLIGAWTLPGAFILYGWTAAYGVQWIVPLIGTAVVGFSICLAMLASENYLVDAYELHSASALSAGVILRAIFGAMFPLCAPALYQQLGLGWGNSVLALCAAVFVPPLVGLIRYGHRLRRSEMIESEFQCDVASVEKE